MPAQAEERRRLILDSALDAIISIDIHGKVLDWNKRAEAMFGWSAEEASGQRLSELIIPLQHRQAHERGMQHFLSTGEGPILNHRLEITALQRSGKVFPIELTVAPARIDGEWIFSSFIRDLTEKKAAENRLYLQSSTARVLAEAQSLDQAVPALLDLVLERTSWDLCGFWQLDPATGHLKMSDMRFLPDVPFESFRKASQALRLSSGVGLPGKVMEAGGPVWVCALQGFPTFQRIPQALEIGLQTAFGFPVYIRDTLLGVFEFYARRELPEDSSLVDALISIGRQLGQFLDRKRSEEALLEKERFLESIYNGAEEAIFVVDIEEDGRYVFRGFNPAYLRRSRNWGVDMRTFLGKTTLDLRQAFPEDLVASVESKYAECAASDGPIEFEDTLMADGRPTYWVTHLTALKNEAGRPYRLIGTSINITRQKEDAARIRETEEQLRQSQKMDAIGRLAGGIAHDFNNLLTAINGYSELALHAESLEAAREMAGEIKRSGERAAELTGQLLAFSRKQILSPSVLDLNSIVSGMDSLLRRVIGEHIELATFLAPGLSPVKVDAGQLEQIVLNLALNARDAMPAGGRLTLETYASQLGENPLGIRLEGRPGPQVVLAVSDSGTGMSLEVKEKLFEPFFTTKEPGKGTGMGLATVYGIVNQSGGRIHVYSEPGRGSSFKIYLPAAQGESLSPGKADREIEPLARGNGETILLVEDEEAVRSYTKRVLEGLGYRVLLAVHGMEALESVSRSEPSIQLLLTDIMMPGMNGRELWERMKSAHPGLRVLFMSGYTDNAIVHNGVLDEDAPFLPKPYSPAHLARKVREALRV